MFRRVHGRPVHTPPPAPQSPTRVLRTFRSSHATARFLAGEFTREDMYERAKMGTTVVQSRLSDRGVTGDTRTKYQVLLAHNEAFVVMFAPMPKGGYMGRNPAFSYHPDGTVTRTSDIRANDVANEGVAMASGGANPHGWTLGLAVIGAFSETNEKTHSHAANDFVPDEHNWDNLVFPDQFGRPRMADGSLLPMEPFSTYKYVEPSDDEPFGYWVTDVPGSYVPQPRRSSDGWGVHLDEDDMYAMTNQRKSLNDDVADAEDEVTDSE